MRKQMLHCKKRCQVLPTVAGLFISVTDAHMATGHCQSESMNEQFCIPIVNGQFCYIFL